MRLIFSGTAIAIHRSNMRSIISMLLYVGVTASISVAYGVEKVKRVVFGDDVYSHATYKTQFAVLFVKTWFCASDQIDHAVKGCHQASHCSGSFLTLDFIVTACHCVTYTYFRQAPKVLTRKPETQWYEFSFESNPRHVLYSELAILAGDPAVDKMTQRRHAEKVFPHPAFRYETRVGDEYSLFDHDIAIVRVCTPFNRASTVQPAPLLPVDKLKPHWDSIVSRSSVCFMAGYGTQEKKGARDLIGAVVAKRLRYTWRYMSCSKVCGGDYNESLVEGNRCVSCTSPIQPRKGNMGPGDSGCGVLCDGYLTAINIAGLSVPSFNVSTQYSYALHCIQNAITPERLEYYRGIKANPQGPVTYLGPVDIQRRHRRHATTILV